MPSNKVSEFPTAGWAGWISEIGVGRTHSVYGKAFDCWHGWGSMATSGGDGTARMVHIKEAQARREKLLGPQR